VSYCTIGFNSTGMSVNDLAWGGNTLYVSSGNWSLSSEVATVTLPFVHNGTTANKVISRFSGGAYSTQAPLEKMSFLTVNGEGRLMGVTTCAPGYSFKTSQLNSSGVVQVTEDFNLSGMNSIRTVGMFVDGKSYLFNLHLDFAVYPDGAIMRIGEKYIDGSQVPAGKYDNNSVKLREWGAGGMTRTPGLTDDDLIIYTGGYKMIAPYSGYQLLTLTSGNVLQLMAVGAPLGISKVSTERKLSVYPNPAADAVYVSVDKADKNARILVYSLDGKEVLSQSASSGQNRVDLSALTKGAYILSVSDGTEMIHKEKILVQ
jgi:hypothetical protein